MGKDSKKKKHKKEKKCKSKHKADKKDRKRKNSSTDSESSDEWVEKDPFPKTVAHENNYIDTMESIFIGKTRNELTEAKKKTEEKKDVRPIYEPGQCSRELNPYWKDGGDGLPPTEAESKSKYTVGDGGAAWLRKALERAKEEAASEGCSVDEVISRRWGSMDEFNKKLKEAESTSGSTRHSKNFAFYKDRRSEGYSHSRFRKPKDYDDFSNRPGKKFNFKKPRSDSDDSIPENKTYDKHMSSEKRRNWKNSKFSADEEKPVIRKRSVERSSIGNKESLDQSFESKTKDSECGETIEEELRNLNKQLFKAEMMGQWELVEELKEKLTSSYRVHKSSSNPSGNPENMDNVKTVLVDSSSKSRKKSKIQTHEQNKRARYFPDDDKHSLQEMFEKEKFSSANDQNAIFYKLSRQKGRRLSSDDEEIYDRARNVDESKIERKKALSIMSREKVLDSCRWCVNNKNSHAEYIVYKKEKVFLAVPTFQPLTETHCLIIPFNHIPAATELDEDVWEEVMDIRKKLVRLFEKDDYDVIFFESALSVQNDNHMVLHCVPVAKEIGDTAPIYFKKAIGECESEWSNNKKVVELAGRNVRKAVPKGLPYFAVDFGLQAGYAHVIEDKRLFSRNFAQEIIGGMLDLDHTIWRKPRKDTFENIKKRMDSLKELLA